MTLIVTAAKTLVEKMLAQITLADTAVLEAANLSMADLTSRLERAIKTAKLTQDEYCYIRDVYDTFFVYSGRYDNVNGHYAVPYTADENGLITLGTPIEVISRTQYDTIDGTPYPPVMNTVEESVLIETELIEYMQLSDTIT